mgnify:FL=1
MYKHEQSKFKDYHLPCPACPSSDALSINEDGSGKCFSCRAFFTAKDLENYEYNNKPNEVTSFIKPINKYIELPGSINPLIDRGISEDVASKYGVKSEINKEGEIRKHFYPYYKNRKLIAYKERYLTNTEKKKGYCWKSSLENRQIPNDLELFGEHLFKVGGKCLTITEGECDAMATYQMLKQNNIYSDATVSIKGGAANALNHLKERSEYISTYDSIVLCFDNDKAGIEASTKVAEGLPSLSGKIKIMALPKGYKDANEMLQDNKYSEFKDSWWDAKVYTPSNLLELSSQKDQWLHRKEIDSVPYPWEGLQSKLLGMRKGELITLTGGTGLGKSSVTRELEHHLITTTEDRVGIIALEENWRRTADGIVSIHANKKLYLKEVREKLSVEQREDLFNEVIKPNKVYIHAHLGATDIEQVFSKLEQLIVSYSCDWIIFDHLHMLVNILTEGDERRGIDTIMHRLRSLVEATGVGMILVSHLRRASGDAGHEKGIEVSLSHLKGSQGIAQLSDCVIALERNQQAVNPEEANTTHVRVLKSRYTGDTGLACSLIYDNKTGRLKYSELKETANEF